MSIRIYTLCADSFAQVLYFSLFFLIKPQPFILRLSAERAWVRTPLTSIATALKAQLPYQFVGQRTWQRNREPK